MLRVERYQNADALWELEDAWRDLWDRSAKPVVFLHPIWAQVWWKHYGDGRKPYLMGVRNEEERLVGLASLCKKESHPHRLEWLGGHELSDSLDFLLEKGLEASVLGALDRDFRSSLGNGTALHLHFVPEDSPTLAETNPMLRGEWDVDVTREEVSPWVSLPRDWEEFLLNLSGKQRHELRRKMGKAQRELKASFHRLDGVAGWPGAMADFVRLHRMSQPGKAVFMDPERESFFFELGEAFHREGKLRLSWLEASGKTVASSLAFVQGETWGLYNSGFDPEYREFSPGIVLVAHTIQQAIQEGLKGYDFLRGSEPYKYGFGARDRDLFRLRLCPRRGDGA
jgi:CelD/BcsL family acetyltransferase involved in cellulose biosynthesis